MGMVIIEGCDCVGKTSTIKELTELCKQHKMPTKTKHFSNPPYYLTKDQQHNFAKEEYYKEIETANNWPGVTFIYDRYFFGEQIYAPKYRGYHPTYVADLEKKLSETGALLVHLTAPVDVVRSRFDGQFIDESHISGIVSEYKRLFNSSTIQQKIEIDTSLYDPKRVAEVIYETIKRTV